MRKLRRVISLLIFVCLSLNSIPYAVYASEEPVNVAENIQLVSVSSQDVSEPLSQGEVSEYLNIANTIQDNILNGETPTLTATSSENETTIYTLDEESTPENIVLEAATYRTNDESAIPIVSYSEINLTQTAAADSSTATPKTTTFSANTTGAETISDTDTSDSPSDASNTFVSSQSETFNDEYVVGDVSENTSASISTVTMEEMLSVLSNHDESNTAEYEAFYNMAQSLGLGNNEKEVVNNLNVIMDDYNQAHAAYEKYLSDYAAYEELLKTNPNALPPEEVKDPTVPRVEINGIDIQLIKSVENVGLTDNGDGTFTVGGDVQGFKTEITVDADAAMTIYYDGKAEITRKVRTDKATDFVITLDVSGSMAWDGRYNAMKKALDVLLGEILANEENTVSIVCWSNSASVVELTVDGEKKNSFSSKDGIEAEDILAALKSPSGGTEPSSGLKKAYDLLSALQQNNNSSDTDKIRNTGVLLFTDGAANYTSSENSAILNEYKLFQDFGATIVNVSIGDEYDVKKYERYLDPESENYKYNVLGQDYTTGENAQENREAYQEKVVYYNIPKLTDQELAEKVTELFEMAFVEIVSEKRLLQTETITEGILAAVEAKLIDTIPAGFELVEISGETTTYQVQGVDKDGNTTIFFDLNDITSGEDSTLSYFVVPISDDTSVGVTALQNEQVVLVAEPVDRVFNDDYANRKTISIVTTVNSNTAGNAEYPTSDSDDISWWNLFQGSKDFEDNRNDTTTNDQNRISGADEWKYMINFCETLKNAGFSDRFIQKCYRELASCKNETMREIILMMFSSDLIEFERKTKNPDGSKWDGSSYATVDNGQLKIVINGYNESVRTIFHEIGHTIDFYSAQLSTQNEEYGIYTVTDQNVENIKKDVENTVRVVVEEKIDKYFKKIDDATKSQYVEYLTYKILNENVPFTDSAENKYGITFSPIFKKAYSACLDKFRTPYDESWLPFGFGADNLVDSQENSAYKYCISDVYGGVTNNNIVDGVGHWDDRKNKWSSDQSYWYERNVSYDANGNAVYGDYLADENGNAIFNDYTICEIWAEYTECIITDKENTDDVINRFFPSYNVHLLRDEMYDLLFNALP